jgi:tRNA pseudouridine-54 N-methylase
MREFIYFSRKARTSGNWKDNDLMKAGRMDIVCHFIIHSFFVSNAIRNNVKLHLIFYGAPDPPKHLEINSNSAEIMSKKDISGLIKRMLYKYKKGQRKEVFPGCFIEKKDLLSVVKKLQGKGKNIYILDRKGIDIKKAKINLDNSTFIIGDQEGLLPKEKKFLRKKGQGQGKVSLISMGNVTYLATQTLIMLQGELDRL